MDNENADQVIATAATPENDKLFQDTKESFKVPTRQINKIKHIQKLVFNLRENLSLK